MDRQVKGHGILKFPLLVCRNSRVLSWSMGGVSESVMKLWIPAGKQEWTGRAVVQASTPFLLPSKTLISSSTFFFAPGTSLSRVPTSSFRHRRGFMAAGGSQLPCQVRDSRRAIGMGFFLFLDLHASVLGGGQLSDGPQESFWPCTSLVEPW